LYGYISDNQLQISGSGFKHFVSSPLTKKVVAQLGLSGVTYSAYDFQGDDYAVDYNKTKIVGDIPEVVYHGTCTKYILGILKTGIMPTENKNWDKLKFPGKIFLTADPDYAKFHANKQADQFNCAPVVIATKIPDRTKITLDYDVAHTFHGDDKKIAATGYLPAIKKNPAAKYHKPKQKAIRKASPKTDFTKATGIFAYTGRIAPTFFQELFSTLNDEEYLGEDPTFTFRSKAEFLQAFEMYEHYGHYDPDYVPEGDEDDENRGLYNPNLDPEEDDEE
jgi:hypothetical protein